MFYSSSKIPHAKLPNLYTLVLPHCQTSKFPTVVLPHYETSTFRHCCTSKFPHCQNFYTVKLSHKHTAKIYTYCQTTTLPNIQISMLTYFHTTKLPNFHTAVTSTLQNIQISTLSCFHTAKLSHFFHTPKNIPCQTSTLPNRLYYKISTLSELPHFHISRFPNTSTLPEFLQSSLSVTTLLSNFCKVVFVYFILMKC